MDMTEWEFKTQRYENHWHELVKEKNGSYVLYFDARAALVEKDRKLQVSEEIRCAEKKILLGEIAKNAELQKALTMQTKEIVRIANGYQEALKVFEIERDNHKEEITALKQEIQRRTIYLNLIDYNVLCRKI